MKQFVIMVYYGSEGWGIHGQTDDVIEAERLYKAALGYASQNQVMVMKPYDIQIKFIEPGPTR